MISVIIRGPYSQMLYQYPCQISNDPLSEISYGPPYKISYGTPYEILSRISVVILGPPRIRINPCNKEYWSNIIKEILNKVWLGFLNKIKMTEKPTLRMTQVQKSRVCVGTGDLQ